MLKQKYFLTGIFILSAERQPIKLAWRKIVWLQDFIQITRFRKTFHILQSTPQISISKVAYDCGYYDKSHLIKEFKMFTGYTPKQLLEICDTYTENLSVFNSVFINDKKT